MSASDYVRKMLIHGDCDVTVISAGSKTTPGGYAHPTQELEQWAINDDRTPTEVFDAVRAKGFEPVWKDWSGFMQEANIPA